MLEPGTEFAGFEIVGPPGKGGMGTVYENFRANPQWGLSLDQLWVR